MKNLLIFFVLFTAKELCCLIIYCNKKNFDNLLFHNRFKYKISTRDLQSNIAVNAEEEKKNKKIKHIEDHCLRELFII